jgi:hypothetical protein
MIVVDKEQIEMVKSVLKDLPHNKSQGPNFYSFGPPGEEKYVPELFPELDHPQAINFFFFALVHDFGFWYGDHKGYVCPLYGTIAGKETKGSDLLWKAMMIAFRKNPDIFKPKEIAYLGPEGLVFIFSDDNGPIPFPDFETRYIQTRKYGEWFCERSTEPVRILEAANRMKETLRSFLNLVRIIPGYNEDKLMKRNLLLAMILANRPEKFLKVTDPEHWRPIVDYHLMRVALRLGMVRVEDSSLRRKLIMRAWLYKEEESLLRNAIYDAFSIIVADRELSMGFIDETFWLARRYCPEMRKPNCEKCFFADVCPRDTLMFQPVIRTTSY